MKGIIFSICFILFATCCLTAQYSISLNNVFVNMGEIGNNKVLQPDKHKLVEMPEKVAVRKGVCLKCETSEKNAVEKRTVTGGEYLTVSKYTKNTSKNEITLSVNSHMPYEMPPIVTNTTDLFSFGLEYNRQLLQGSFGSRFTFGTGLNYRNYGYKPVQKYVPYITVPVNINWYLFRLWKFEFWLNNAVEWAIPLSNQYQFPDPAYPAYQKYQLFLHKNYAFLYTAGLGIRKNLGKLFYFSANAGINMQLDKSDAPYAKNLGAITTGLRFGCKF